MKIGVDKTIEGYPHKNIKALFRASYLRTLNIRYFAEVICKELKVDGEEAYKIIQKLRDNGYLTIQDGKWIQNTPKGNNVALSKLRRISRQKAVAQLEELIDRARKLNSKKYHPYLVDSITVFGSFLSESEDLGDIDLVVRLTPVYEDKERQQEYEESFVKREVRKGAVPVATQRSWFRQLMWPRESVMRYLIGKSRSFELHGEDDLAVASSTSVVYERR